MLAYTKFKHEKSPQFTFKPNESLKITLVYYEKNSLDLTF